MRAADPAKRPFLKRVGTRKRLGAIQQANLESMAQSYTGAPDNSPGRAGSSSRKSAYKLRRQLYSLLDMLAAGQDRGLPQPRDALHMLLGIVATQKFGASWERTAQPFVDAYFNDAPRENILLVLNRLNDLAAAESLWAQMPDTNRQDVQGVMAALKRSAMRELAGRGIGLPLHMLAGSLAERQPDSRLIAKAWFQLEEGVREAAYKERVPPIDYLQAGLERLPSASTRVLSAVLANRVPAHARMARHILDNAIEHTPRDPAIEDGRERLQTYMVSEAVRLHVVSCMERKIAEAVSRFENAVRPGVRTAEVANREWHDIRRMLDTLGWIYLQSDRHDASDERVMVDAAAELHFACAVMLMPHPTAAAFLERLDTERLLAMHAHQHEWSDEQRVHLAAPLQQACEARFSALRDTVEAARSDVETVTGQDRRIATAHALLALSDALAACERFARRSGNPRGWREDPRVDAAIQRAAGSLRMPGEPGNVLGQPSLRALGDEAFGQLRQIDAPQVAAALALDLAAVAAEIRRRLLHLDMEVDARLAQMASLLRSPGLAPRPFVAAIASVALAEMSRCESMAAFRDGAVEHGVHAASSALNRQIAMMLYRKDGAMPMQWTEARRHIGGLLDALRRIRMAGRDDGTDAEHWHRVTLAPLDTAIAVLCALGRHFGVQPPDAANADVFPAATDPYWNPGCLAEIAPFFGLRYEPSLRMAVPLCGSMHRARLLAALGMRMAQPDSSATQAGVARVDGQSQLVQIDKSFHDAAHRRGELSLTVHGPASRATLAPRSAAAGSELVGQSPWSLEGELGKLGAFGQGADLALTRLMSAMAQGAADFVRDARELPQAWRWSSMLEPQAVRHIHFGVNEMPQGGYRVDVSACLETGRADMEVQLNFAMRVNATAGRVTGLIVPPEARLLPAEAAASGNIAAAGVTTGGFAAAKAPGDGRTLVAAAAA
ncbi:hypothetical protein AKI39_01775 [Bordetella sp. H567]|nr:hypothetical protein AKI39_01775 [Bordetella sp. H567]